MREERFILLGDAVWLDFINTARGRHADPPDRLRDAAAWSAWLDALQLSPDPASFDAALTLRAQLTSLAVALAAGQPSPSSCVGAVNDLLASVSGAQRLVRLAGQWQLTYVPATPPGPLAAIARSAAESLALPAAAIRVCEGPSCSLILQDRSSTQFRRWCSIEHCGKGMRVERRRGGT